MKLKEIKCPLCRTENAHFLYKMEIGSISTRSIKNEMEDVGNIYKCCNCSFIFKEIESTNINLGDYYANLTYDYYQSLHGDGRYKEHAMMARLINKNLFSGKILDIGCGTGEFLNILSPEKWEKWGVEPAKFTNEILEKNGIKAVTSGFMESDLPNNYFDVVTMFDVIEHIDNPVNYIKLIKKVLKDDGIVLVATPNVTSLMAHLSGKYWYHFSPIGHITFYNPKILKKIMQKEGFENFFIKKYDYNLSFTYAIIKLFKESIRFVLKKAIIYFSKFIFLTTKVNLLQILPEFYSPKCLPWFYDFFLIKATNSKNK